MGQPFFGAVEATTRPICPHCRGHIEQVEYAEVWQERILRKILVVMCSACKVALGVVGEGELQSLRQRGL